MNIWFIIFDSIIWKFSEHLKILLYLKNSILIIPMNEAFMNISSKNMKCQNINIKLHLKNTTIHFLPITVVAYSTAFRLLEYEEILWFLEWFLELLHCRRFDICMDVKTEINAFLETYFSEHTTWREYKKAWKIQTRYYGEVMNSRNKRQLIRVYDKILDIKEKQKYKLFADYFALWDVTRIELEVRQELAKEISYKDIFNDALLLSIFKNYLGRQTDIFGSLPVLSQTLYRDKKKYRYINGKRREIDSEEMQGIFYATGRKNTFIWHARAIYNLWFCPVRVLIGEGYIKPKTERILWSDLIQHLLRMESKLKQEFYLKKARKKDFQHLLDNSPEYENNGE